MMNEIHTLLSLEYKFRLARFLKEPDANPPAAQEIKYTASTTAALLSNRKTLVLM